MIFAPLSISLIKIFESIFLGNFGSRGAGLSFALNSNSLLTLDKVKLIKNVDLTSNPAILLVYTCRKVVLHDCLFAMNTGTPVEIISSKLFLCGSTIFRSNAATNGGGLSLICSTVTFLRNFSVIFDSNTALNVGGAIFVAPCYDHNRVTESSSYDYVKVTSACFFQLIFENGLSDTYNLRFYNNSALSGGEDIYGTHVYKRCIAQTVNNQAVVMVRSELQQLFKLSNSKNTSLSSIASDPKRVCVCDSFGEPQCGNLDFIYLRKILYPGEKFTVPLVVVGEEFGTVTATARASLLGTTGSLGRGEQTQLAHFQHCTNMEYSVHSAQEIETIVFSIHGSMLYDGRSPWMTEYNQQDVLKFEYCLNLDASQKYASSSEISPRLLTTSVYCNVTLINCPLGFELTGNPPSCQCQYELIKSKITPCIIVNHTGFIYRTGTTWVNATFIKNSSIPIVYKSCPYGYCLSVNTSVDLRYPDTQCDLGHSGTLCGGCRENLSLALGSNRCLDCSNSDNFL